MKSSPLQTLGDACDRATDCAAPLTCFSDVTGGICSRSCGSDSDCGQGLCFNARCYAPCAAGGNQCSRAGASCIGRGSNLHCVPVIPASCADQVRNGQESDIDCGGPSCAPCAAGLACAVERDCESRSCKGGVCRTGCGDFAFTCGAGSYCDPRGDGPGCQCDATSCPGCCNRSECYCQASFCHMRQTSMFCGDGGRSCVWCAGIGMPFNACVVDAQGGGPCLSNCPGCWTHIGDGGDPSAKTGICVPGDSDDNCGLPFLQKATPNSVPSDGFCFGCTGGTHCKNGQCL